MIERLNTHRNFTFSERDLLRYLKTVNKFSKMEEEILATLKFKHAYQKLVIRSGLFISFPYKEGSESELNKYDAVQSEKVGWFIREFIEENSPVDSILVNQKNIKPTFQKSLQIKFFGNFDKTQPTDLDLVRFLHKYSTYAPTDTSLVILTENYGRIETQKAKTWLNENKFPFSEVVLVGNKESKKRNDYLVLKP